MTGPVAIYGAGGHARVLAAILHQLNLPILGYFDDSFIGPENIQGAPVLGRFNDIVKFQGKASSAFLAIGDNALREKAFHFLKQEGFSMPPLIHPGAIVESDVAVGEGSVVCIGAVIGTEVKIGSGAILNTGCIVDHESEVGDFVHLAPGVTVAGRTSVGHGTFVGMNASISNKIRIGRKSVIGAGSVVLRDVPDNHKVLGLHS